MLERLKQHRITVHLARSLVALLFVQLLVPLQAHSRIIQDAHGLTVVVCTLEGAKSVQIDLDGPTAHHPHASAAMAFSDLLNNVSPLISVVQAPMQVLSWRLVVPTDSVPLIHREQLTPSSRGPPLA